ncbi:MAG: DNA-binding protein, partial [Gammaproteobacteria bacterium]
MTVVDRVQDAIQQLEREGIKLSVRTVYGRTGGSYPQVAEALRRIRQDLVDESAPPPPQEVPMPPH